MIPLAGIATTPPNVSQTSNDILYGPFHSLFYLSVISPASSHAHTFAVLDPTGTVTFWQPTGVNPNVLARSDDGQFLYVGIDAAAQRFILPIFVNDINYSLPTDSFGAGPLVALDLQVAPATPQTVAISLGVTTSTPAAQGGIVIYDDGSARPTTGPGFGPGRGAVGARMAWLLTLTPARCFLSPVASFTETDKVRVARVQERGPLVGGRLCPSIINPSPLNTSWPSLLT